MKFKDANDWLNFASHTELEVLENIIENNDIGSLLDNSEDVMVSNKIILECYHKLKSSRIEDKFWSNTLFFIDSNSLTDEIFNMFFENNVAIDILGHLPLRDEFLWRLTDEVVEAILTLGIRHYTEDKYSVEEFKELLLKFTNIEWLWRIILSRTPDNLSKWRVFKKVLFSSTDFSDVKQEMIDQSIERNLKSSKGIKQINKYYKTGIPRYLRGISQNPLTPTHILEELSRVQDIKYASHIRRFALNNIKSRKANAQN